MSRILIYIDRDENRRILAEWLSQEHKVVEGSATTDLEQEFDLCIVDRASIEQYGEELLDRKHREQPVLLPYLFVIPERQLDRMGADIWQRMDAVIRDRVDELITTPIKKAELEGRLENLLNSRELSLRLKEQREQYRRLISVAPETIATIDRDGEITYLNSRGAELFDAGNPESLYGESLFDFIHEDERDDLRTMVKSVDATQEDAGFLEARIVTDGHLRHVEIGAAAITYERQPAVQLVIRDVTDRYRREQQVQRQRDALQKLNRLNDVIRDINQALVQASTREEIEQAVCDRLVGVDRYVAAWIGNDRATSRAVTARASAGSLGEYLDAVEINSGQSSNGPAGQALAQRAPQVINNVSTDLELEQWHEAAMAHGFESIVSVPIVYEDTLYGVLNIYADRPNAFDDDEQAVLCELGETIGHAINAAESRRALLTDRIIELDFQIRESESFLTEATSGNDHTFVYEGIVSNTDGRYIEYFSVECENPETVVDLAESSKFVETVRLVGEHGGEALFEFVFEHDLVVRAFSELGGRIDELSVVKGMFNVTVEFPYRTDTRAIVDALEAKYDHVDLMAQREKEQPVESRQEVWAAFRESLTDRQWSSLQTAYYAGFFNWPRSSTGEEVAESLNISPATFHEHLRAAQRKLLTSLLDG